MNYSCQLCTKKYKTKHNYQKHYILCQFLRHHHDNSYNDLDDELPDKRTLYNIVIDLSHKYSKLENKLNELTKWVDTKREKISIIDWLNNNHKPDISYYDWIQNILFNQQHLDIIFKHDLVIGIINCFKLLFDNNYNSLPIKAFQQKQVLYFYSNETWNVIDEISFQPFINHILKQAMNQLIIWQDNNKRFMNNDAFAMKYTLNVQKIMASNYTQHQIYSKIHNG